MSSLHIARSGLDALDARMRTISNNLANAATVGFKRDRATLETLPQQMSRPAGAATAGDPLALGLSTGGGVRVLGTERVHAQGGFTNTGEALDLAVDGDGLFEVGLPDGRTAYTRAGDFTRDAEGRLVTGQGHPVLPAIQIPANATQVTVAPDGTVTASQPGSAAPVEVGRIGLAAFANPGALQPIGANLFVETAGSGAPRQGAPGEDGLGTLRQGALEASNVNVVQELVEMIETQRAYELNAKVINAASEMQRYVNQNL